MAKTEVVFSEEALAVYNLLKKKSNSKLERMLVRAIDEKIKLVAEDRQYGNPIAKKLIPQEYKVKYKITNLFRVELPVFWRMMYSNTNNANEIEIVAFVVEILDHPSYDKRFRYKKK